MCHQLSSIILLIKASNILDTKVIESDIKFTDYSAYLGLSLLRGYQDYLPCCIDTYKKE